MTTGIGMYDNLNNGKDIAIPLDINELAKIIVDANYGLHRMLSALVREEKKTISYNKYGSDLVNGIERMLNEGKF